MAIEDEHGTFWVVKAGDPANQHCLKLKRLGFVWQVLPRKVLLGGEGGAECDDPLRKMRMLDCLEVISD